MTAYNHHLTLLIIDDDVVNIASLSSLFAKTFNIETAQDGKVALQIIMLKDIDLVLSVVNLPIISGQILCTFVKNSQLTAYIPVIFLADKPSLDEEEECLAVGAADYINRCTRPNILMSRVTDLKGAKQVAQELIQNVQNISIQAAKNASHPFVTISVGISAFSPTQSKNAVTTPIDLINKADINLYKAKQAGRNKYSATT